MVRVRVRLDHDLRPEVKLDGLDLRQLDEHPVVALTAREPLTFAGRDVDAGQRAECLTRAERLRR